MPISRLPDLDFNRLFDFRVNEAIRKASADKNEAAGVLLLAAEYLRRHEPLPYPLADYLADAFETAMVKPENHRLRELGFELNLKQRNKPRHVFDVPAAYALIQTNFHLVDQSSGAPNFYTPALVKLLMKKGRCGDSHARRLLKQINRIFTEEAKLIFPPKP